LTCASFLERSIGNKSLSISVSSEYEGWGKFPFVIGASLILFAGFIVQKRKLVNNASKYGENFYRLKTLKEKEGKDHG